MQQPQQSSSSSSNKERDLLKKKKEKTETRCGHCDGCRSRALGKKGKCEKRMGTNQQKKKDKKIKDGRLKYDEEFDSCSGISCFNFQEAKTFYDSRDFHQSSS